MSKRWGLYGGAAGLGAAYYWYRGSKETSLYPTSPTTVSPGAARAAKEEHLNTTAGSLVGVQKALDPNEWKNFTVSEKSRVTHNTFRLRFAFPDKDMASGLTTASCLLTKAPLGKEKEDGSKAPVIRPYTPENLGDQKGFLDLVVKGYPQGKMSKHIVDLEVGDKLEFKGPIGKLPYVANMKKKIGMIAGGSGLTPMLQVIKEIARNPQDTTEVTFVFANQSLEDIILKKELDEIAATHKNINMYYLVDKAPPGGWEGGVGHLTEDIARQQLPPPSDDHLILVCGPPPMMKAISGDKAPDKSQGELEGILAKIGYTKDQVYKF